MPMPMPMLPKVLQDKRALAVAAVGAAGGAWVLLRGRGTKGAGTASASTGSTAGGGAAGGGIGNPGAYDSSGTDAYNNLQTSLDNQLTEFRNNLTGITEQLSTMTPGGTTQSGPSLTTTPATPAPPAVSTTKPVGTPKPVTAAPKATAPKAAPPKPSGAKTVKIKSGQTLTSIAKANGTSITNLLKLNPSITDKNKIIAGKSLRVK